MVEVDVEFALATRREDAADGADFDSDRKFFCTVVASRRPGTQARVLSRDADDGEVIFLFEASDELQRSLIAKAFEVRAKRRLSAG